MRTIETEVHIDASPAEIWSVLVDFPRLDWNPLFASISGSLAVGGRLKIVLRKPKVTLRAKVTALEPERLVEWRGHPGIPGLVDGRHVFELAAAAGGGTTLRHGETFTGILAPLAPIASTRRGFEAFNQALKAEVETRLRRAQS